jgi:hypothetical protein
MRKGIGFLMFVFVFCSSAFAQTDIQKMASKIEAEGKMLYRSEMASWYGTDVFLEAYKDRENIGGYFSYLEKDNAVCIFYSKVEPVQVIGTIRFDESYNISKAKVDLQQRSFSKKEQDLYSIRIIATKISATDTLFKRYKNSNLNLIPIVDGKEKKVYFLTGPEQNGVVIFGNDYLITFDDENNVTSKKCLHQNIVFIDYTKKDKEAGGEVVGAIHNHKGDTSPFITATDICTLMLYSKFAKWKQHTVVSEKYISIWNCETNSLVAIPRDVMDKIEKDQKERYKE